LGGAKAVELGALGVDDVGLAGVGAWAGIGAAGGQKEKDKYSKIETRNSKGKPHKCEYNSGDRTRESSL
jgi:hypothetical protein